MIAAVNREMRRGMGGKLGQRWRDSRKVQAWWGLGGGFAGAWRTKVRRTDIVLGGAMADIVFWGAMGNIILGWG